MRNLSKDVSNIHIYTKAHILYTSLQVQKHIFIHDLYHRLNSQEVRSLLQSE